MQPVIYMVLSVAVVVAIGLSVYNFITVRAMKRAVGMHNTLLDLAEFQNLDPSIKAYYLNIVKDVMPEVMDYANIVWTSPPATNPGPGFTKGMAEALKARKPAFREMVKKQKLSMSTNIPKMLAMMPPPAKTKM